MLVICAPYAPIRLSAAPNLGAARKLESVIEVLSALDEDVLLVNSAHNSLERQTFADSHIDMKGVNVRQLVLPTYQSRRLGKLLNLTQVQECADRVLAQGRPDLIWLYNGYAFESAFARSIRSKVDCPVVLEFEDWHFSRRPLNPKPLIDYLSWLRLRKVASHVFAVNSALAEKVRRWPCTCSLLPGLVSNSLVSTCEKRKPFTPPNRRGVMGYFGGLSDEKGADQIVRLARRTPDGWKLLVAGAGPLESAFREAALANDNAFFFHPRASDEMLEVLIAECDVIINPHRPIVEMQDGVFPFKVIEALASGRQLISTELPDAGVPHVRDVVLYYDGSYGDLTRAIEEARSFYLQRASLIERVSSQISYMYGQSKLSSQVSGLLRRSPPRQVFNS